MVRRRAGSVLLTTAGWFWHGNIGASLYALIALYLGGLPAAGEIGDRELEALSQ